MKNSPNKEMTFTVQVDATELTPQHRRLIKTINILLGQALMASDEATLFKQTKEVTRLIAALIKQSKMATTNKSTIAYAEQALEYALESTLDQLYSNKVVVYDN